MAVPQKIHSFLSRLKAAWHKFHLFLEGGGPELPAYEVTAWLFLRLLGFVFFAAFLSFGVQALSLIGSDGLLPLNEFTQAMKERFGEERFILMPMVFWIADSDLAIRFVCTAGALLSIFLTVGFLPRLSLIALYILYLSLIYAGQVFMSFQWDLLLVETALVALLLCFARRPGIWLLRFLLFRFMLLGGLVKIMSGDPSWHNFTALSYHFETQPLPSPVAYYMHFMPAAALKFLTIATLVIELVVPFFIFAPRSLRFFAGFCFLLLQSAILLTGNYNFFNILTILLCLPLFDDRALRKVIPQRLHTWIAHCKDAQITLIPRRIVLTFAALSALVIISASYTQFHMRFFRATPPPLLLMKVNEAVSPLRAVSTYGPFAVMTKTRPEIIFEGTRDGRNWEEYSLKYKPGTLEKAPSWNIPHQPRFDWQLWFAAMNDARRNPWVTRFMIRLLEDKETAGALLAHNPFPDAPPRAVRALLYDYKFVPPEKRRESGKIWQRKLRGIYHPPVSLQQK